MELTPLEDKILKSAQKPGDYFKNYSYYAYASWGIAAFIMLISIRSQMNGHNYSGTLVLLSLYFLQMGITWYLQFRSMSLIRKLTADKQP